VGGDPILTRTDLPGRLEVVAVDDCSTDHTSDILLALASERPGGMNVLRAEELPPGWLGKNYALFLGAE
jgi:glycosyltransferase involved in cell wall biosynthesis